ncbi:MAG: hypothetical protein ACRDK0_15590 [Solirubrobacteraceae bacterium]
MEEIIAAMRAAGDGAQGRRLRGLIVVLWRAGVRVQEADLDHRRGSMPVRHVKGRRRREVGTDAWGREQLQQDPMSTHKLDRLLSHAAHVCSRG